MRVSTIGLLGQSLGFLQATSETILVGRAKAAARRGGTEWQPGSRRRVCSAAHLSVAVTTASIRRTVAAVPKLPIVITASASATAGCTTGTRSAREWESTGSTRLSRDFPLA